MRIRISHESIYRYEAPVAGVIQTLRLTPPNHDGQYVVSWRIDISEDCRLDYHEDAFGNITHTFTAEGTFTELGVTVDGDVETQDTNGIVRGAIERFPPSLFLRAPALRLSGSLARVHQRGAQPRHPGALRRRLLPSRRRRGAAGGGTCLGRGIRARHRLGRL